MSAETARFKWFALFSLAFCLLTGGLPALAQDADDENEESEQLADSVTQKFLQGLRDRGYFDIEREYLEKLRGSSDVDEDLKATIDLLIGKSLSSESENTQDFEKQKELLAQARARFDAFIKANPNHPKKPEALVQLAKLHYLRGVASRIESEQGEAVEKQAKAAESRAAFAQARKAYDDAIKPLKDAYDKFPLAGADMKKEQRAEKDSVHQALMNAKLQRALVDYEEAQSFPLGSKERNDLLDQGIKAFESIHRDYRTMMAGLTARAMQGKCFEERGEDGIGPAMGIYEEILGHPDSRLRPLQRKVAFYKIIALSKRKEYARRRRGCGLACQRESPDQAIRGGHRSSARAGEEHPHAASHSQTRR